MFYNIINTAVKYTILCLYTANPGNRRIHQIATTFINDYTDAPMTNHRRRKRGDIGGQAPPNNLRGGPTYPLAPVSPPSPGPPNNPPTFSFNFYVKQENITDVPS